MKKGLQARMLLLILQVKVLCKCDNVDLASHQSSAATAVFLMLVCSFSFLKLSLQEKHLKSQVFFQSFIISLPLLAA